MSSSTAQSNPAAYRAVTESAGFFDRSSRPRLEVKGPDRAKFLHNMTTNDVKRLAEGSGHESFVTTPQGKVLAYVTLLATEAETILLRTDPDSLEALLAHLRKYGVFDEVAIEDVTSTTFEVHLAGPASAGFLTAAGADLPAEGTLRNRPTVLAGFEVRVVREAAIGRPGFTLIGPVEAAGSVKSALSAAGMAELDEATFDSLRVEAGMPVSGRDVTSGHLPQEVGRDSAAINFVKGCYLGQETVARLDALGHVNRIFRGLRLTGTSVPTAGTPLSIDGKAVGSITSSAFSPGWGGPIALGYVRVAQADSGTKLVATIEGVGEVEAIVAELPMLPTAPA